MYDMGVKDDYRNISGLNWGHLQNPGFQFFVQIFVAMSDSKQWTLCVSVKEVSGFFYSSILGSLFETVRFCFPGSV